jgi:cadmium resistance protein CadD (predicted permease)
MTALREDGSGWRKLAVLILAVAAIGLPVNNITDYALLVILAVVVFSGEVSARPGAWGAALAIVAVAIAGQAWLAPPRMVEGHNVFLPGPTMERMLPPDVYRAMATEFDALYPPAKRCDPKAFGCWQNNGFPEKPFAFSADSVWRKSSASRDVTSLDFIDPVWLRLGFLNEVRYNWTADTDVKRGERDKRIWAGLARWRVTMPWYEMVQLPAAYVGGEVCWRGQLMWEGSEQRFSLWQGDGCRAIEPADVGRRIFGMAIQPDTLAMYVTPPWSVRLLLYAKWAIVLAALVALVGVLVEDKRRRTILPFVLIGLAVLVIAIDDGSFLGGVRPLDGGDDGLFYDGYGRLILAKLLAGDIWGALEGGEKVFYYGGPGLRYFRAIEHVIFGESYLGYLSLVLVFPFFAFALFRRFLPPRWAIALILLFVAVPIGTLFGTTFVQYEKWASRGFADPAAYMLFIAGLAALVPSVAGPTNRFSRAFFAALLLALGIFMKPIVAPAAAVLLGGAGLAALYYRQWPRLAGLCIGFIPVLVMPLHNLYFGHVFVLFSANSADSNLLVMPPSAYVAALRDLLHLDFSGVARVLRQLGDWLSGPAESYATIPLNAAGVAILTYVVLRGRALDPWLRLIGGAALVQHAVALFYNAATARYHFLTWFLTMLVGMVWFHDVGIAWLKQRFPTASQRVAVHPLAQRLASGLARLQKASS